MQHQWLDYTSKLARQSVAREVAQAILNYINKSSYSITQLRKARTLDLQWNDPPDFALRTRQLRFDELAGDLQRLGRYDSKELNLPLLLSWNQPPNYHVEYARPPEGEGNELVKLQAQLPLGDAFPIRPQLDREGAIFTSMREIVVKRIAELHGEIVTGSRLQSLGDPHWICNIRALLNECISAVEIELHTLYLNAEYCPKPGWTFDQDRLGSRNRRRLLEKLKWVGAITGTPLDNIEVERRALSKLKELRNHLNHFDPPCFSYTIEEVAEWLNMVPAIGTLIWKIASRAGEPLTGPLTEVILLRTVKFCAPPPGTHRAPQLADAGYASCRWQSHEEASPTAEGSPPKEP